jgi:hypothetical protein
MKSVILIGMLCVFAISNSYSQTKQESISELFHLMQKDSVIDKTLASMMPSLSKMTLPDGTVIAESQMNQFTNIVKIAKELSAKMQTEEMALYDKYFSQKEIQELIAFYKTETGKKFIDMTPKMKNELSQIVRQKYMPEILQTIISTRQPGATNTK